MLRTESNAGPMKTIIVSLIAAAALNAGCSKSQPPAPTTTPVATTDAAQTAAAPAARPADVIAWRYASNDADVDTAFGQARAEAKPVFVYWGATWCPPCNQVKATLFNRQDFIQRSRAFVPVYVDGDSPGAQRLGSRFKVNGYPTMLLFNARGDELTRLPGEVEGERYAQVLTLGMNAQRPVKDVLAQVLADAKGISANDWRLLAFYSWDTDQQQLVPKEGVPALMKQLADACPVDQGQGEIATRLRLKALAAVDGKAPARPDAAAQAMLLKLLADGNASRVHLDLLTNDAVNITRALSKPGTPQRAELLRGFNAALKRFEADTTLSRADRMQALIAQVDLARIDVKTDAALVLPEPLLADIRDQTARADGEITDGYERQAVITSAAYLLDQAGLSAESDALLTTNLAKSHAPYYLMSELASNARRRGDKAEALRWYQAAFDRSEGPATRLQWGASFVNALIELAPQDARRIEQAAGRLFAEASQQPDAFYGRSGRSLERVDAKLQAWSKSGAHAAAIKRLQAQLDSVCGALDASDPQRARCTALLHRGRSRA
jgi:thioredoxin-like negative regulator of GroEL